MCELAISSYIHSFYRDSVRAGNVIGDGDFSDNHIIPDMFHSIQLNQSLSMEITR